MKNCESAITELERHILKKIERIDRNMDEDSASQQITGQYIHYKTQRSFERAVAKRERLSEKLASYKEMEKKAKAFDVLNKKMIMGVDDYGEDGIFLNVSAAEDYDDFEEGAIIISFKEKKILMDAGL